MTRSLTLSFDFLQQELLSVLQVIFKEEIDSTKIILKDFDFIYMNLYTFPFNVGPLGITSTS